MTDTLDSEPIVEVLDDADSVFRRVADWLAGEAEQTEGRFAIALSGGSTPRSMYTLLARPPDRDAIPWSRVHLFWGDERFVPHDDSDSNYRMVREALIDRVPIPGGNVHPIPTGGRPTEAAAAYAATLHQFYGTDTLDPARPLFDVVLLGLGTDGHTASLFPGSPALDEKRAWVVPVEAHAGAPRITLTYPALASSRNLAFLVTGAEKSDILSRILQCDPALPAARVRTGGRCRWFVDRAAAERWTRAGAGD